MIGLLHNQDTGGHKDARLDQQGIPLAFLQQNKVRKSTEINGALMRITRAIESTRPRLRAWRPRSAPVARPALLLGWDGAGGTHLHLALGQPLLPGPLANVIRVTSLEGYSGHGPLTKADLPTNSPSQPASTSLFKVLEKRVS